MSSLVLSERIQTTESKAKAIKPEIEKLVTKAKKEGSGARRVLEQSLSRPAFEKIIKEIAPRFSKRQGGYTRILKLGERLGDDASMAIIEWVETAEIVPVENKKEATKESKPKKAEKKAVKTKVTKAGPKKAVKKSK